MNIVGYEDYIDRLHAEFPEIDHKSIASILQFGSGKMLYYKKLNIDLFIKDDVNLKYYVYIGDVTKDPYKRNAIYFKKKRRKLRHMYALDKVEHDGYYYFGLNNEQHEQFKLTNIIDRTIYYKILKETYIRPTNSHIYRVKMEDASKWFILKENYEERSAQYIQSRNGYGFDSINHTE